MISCPELNNVIYNYVPHCSRCCQQCCFWRCRALVFWQLTLYWFWFFRVPNGGHLKFDYDRFWQIRSKKKNGKKQKKITGNRYLMRIQPRGRVNVLISTTWAQLEVAFWGHSNKLQHATPIQAYPRGGCGWEIRYIRTHNLYYKYTPHQKRIHLLLDSHNFSLLFVWSRWAQALATPTPNPTELWIPPPSQTVELLSLSDNR